MSALTRYDQLIFASIAGTDQISKFGSLKAGSPVRYDGSTVTPALVQALSNYLSGWADAVVDGSSPAIEDMNALFYLLSYQLAYIYERGVPEWAATTTYYIGSIVQIGGQIFVSKTDSNLNNSPSTSTANWYIQGQNVRTTLTSGSVTLADNIVRGNPLSGDITLTLDAASTFPQGHKLVIKNIQTNGNKVTISTPDSIDGVSSFVLNSDPVMDSVTLSNYGSGWDII